MEVMCLLCSMEDEIHSHAQPRVRCEVVKREGNNFIIRTPEGLVCTGVYNPFTEVVYADDKYGVIRQE